MVKDRKLAILLHFVFFLSGITTILIGQVLPILSRGLALNDLQAGYLFPAQFGGAILGTLASNWFGRLNGFVSATVVGSSAMALGVTAMSMNSFEGCLAGFFVNGLGVGLTLPAINMLVLEMNPLRGASALSILNFCWGLGAIVCKPFVDATASEQSIYVTSVFLSIPLLIGAALIALLPRDRASKPLNITNDAASMPQAAAIWTGALAWAVALFNFIQVGFESGVGGWLTTYADRLHGAPVINLFSPTFLYFLFFVAGRGVAPLYFRFMSENQVLFLDIGLMLVGMLIILAAYDLAWLSIGAAVAGLGASSVFPTNLSRFARTFGPAAAHRATPLFISGTLGGAAVTVLIGSISNQVTDLRAGMFVLLACVGFLGMIQIALAIRRIHRPEP
ncbi:MAG: MFS transporter [Acidobacteria bacterium]|nr:MFS transporter [Acidobacteriota bacterium]